MSSQSEKTASGSDEAALVDRVRCGDTQAFEILVDRYSDQAFGVAYGFLGHVQDAEDLVQDGFIRALEQIDSLQPGSGFGAWFYRLLVNAAINRRRYLARREMSDLPADAAAASDPAAAAEQSDLRRELARALHSLPEELETVVVLHDLEGFTHPEVARILGMPEGTSRSHLHRARRVLREKLKEYEHHLP